VNPAQYNAYQYNTNQAYGYVPSNMPRQSNFRPQGQAPQYQSMGFRQQGPQRSPRQQNIQLNQPINPQMAQQMAQQMTPQMAPQMYGQMGMPMPAPGQYVFT
jgi:hypothetical protein